MDTDKLFVTFIFAFFLSIVIGVTVFNMQRDNNEHALHMAKLSASCAVEGEI